MSDPNVPQPPFPPGPVFDARTGKETVPTGGYVPLSASKVYALWIDATVLEGPERPPLDLYSLPEETRAVWLTFAKLLRDYIRG